MLIIYRRCDMALKSTPDVPHKGWKPTDVIDLHDDEGREFGNYEDCEFCGHEQIRFVHLLGHAEYPKTIRVGCICACLLTNDYKNPKERERKLKNRANRKAKFLSRKWKPNRYGGETITLNGYRVTVGQPRPAAFRIWINGKEGKLTFADARSAKLRAFDAVQSMRERGT
jgi:hypothetical protein